MTQKEIIEMAKQAGLLHMDYELGQWEIHEFTTFAKLIAEKEREACAELIPSQYYELRDRIRARGQA